MSNSGRLRTFKDGKALSSNGLSFVNPYRKPLIIPIGTKKGYCVFTVWPSQNKLPSFTLSNSGCLIEGNKSAV